MAQPWKNSLQMAFLPVPGLPNLLFSKYETRQSDWASYQQQSETEEGILWQNEFGARVKSRVPMRTLTAAGWVDVPNTSQTTVPYFPTEPESAACGINHFMAQRFCSWLTWTEQRQGRIGPGEYYRLPTDAEWSQAADLPPERGLTPKERHEKLASTEHRYPWGPEWPPPVNFANYAGKEARDAEWPETWNSLKLRKDEFPRTAPVGRFAANRHGLHDLWGNVWEWCSDALSPSAGTLVLRGASWVDGGYDVQLRRDFRNAHPAAFRDSTTGFRCVLVLRKRDGK